MNMSNEDIIRITKQSAKHHLNRHMASFHKKEFGKQKHGRTVQYEPAEAGIDGTTQKVVVDTGPRHLHISVSSAGY